MNEPTKPEPTLDPKESLATAIAFSSRDWGADHRDAWIYAIITGWGHEAMQEMIETHGWDAPTVHRLHTLRKRFESLQQPITRKAYEVYHIPRGGNYRGRTVAGFYWSKEDVAHAISYVLPQDYTYRSGLIHVALIAGKWVRIFATELDLTITGTPYGNDADYK